MPRILGIDPGSRITGFGVIDSTQAKPTYLTSGCIRLTDDALPQRLHEIYQSLNTLISEFTPTHLAIEAVFIARNAASALKLGHARGVAIVACVQHGLAVYEYSPNRVKQAVVGQGHADKTQVQHMVKVLLNLPAAPQVDAADALAAALCHAHTLQHQQRFARGVR